MSLKNENIKKAVLEFRKDLVDLKDLFDMEDEGKINIEDDGTIIDLRRKKKD